MLIAILILFLCILSVLKSSIDDLDSHNVITTQSYLRGKVASVTQYYYNLYAYIDSSCTDPITISSYPLNKCFHMDAAASINSLFSTSSLKYTYTSDPSNTRHTLLINYYSLVNCRGTVHTVNLTNEYPTSCDSYPSSLGNKNTTYLTADFYYETISDNYTSYQVEITTHLPYYPSYGVLTEKYTSSALCHNRSISSGLMESIWSNAGRDPSTRSTYCILDTVDSAATISRQYICDGSNAAISPSVKVYTGSRHCHGIVDHTLSYLALSSSSSNAVVHSNQISSHINSQLISCSLASNFTYYTCTSSSPTKAPSLPASLPPSSSSSASTVDSSSDSTSSISLLRYLHLYAYVDSSSCVHNPIEITSYLLNSCVNVNTTVNGEIAYGLSFFYQAMTSSIDKLQYYYLQSVYFSAPNCVGVQTIVNMSHLLYPATAACSYSASSSSASSSQTAATAAAAKSLNNVDDHHYYYYEYLATADASYYPRYQAMISDSLPAYPAAGILAQKFLTLENCSQQVFSSAYETAWYNTGINQVTGQQYCIAGKDLSYGYHWTCNSTALQSSSTASTTSSSLLLPEHSNGESNGQVSEEDGLPSLVAYTTTTCQQRIAGKKTSLQTFAQHGIAAMCLTEHARSYRCYTPSYDQDASSDSSFTKTDIIITVVIVVVVTCFVCLYTLINCYWIRRSRKMYTAATAT